MFRVDGLHSDGIGRRDFLRLGAAPALGAVKLRESDASCILLMMVGGPSQLDTFDLKPEAPSEIRGPFRPIRTNVPGIEISEIFPRIARQADKFSLIRSMYHTGSAVHDAGHHVMQTGRLFRDGQEHPSLGSVVSHLRGGRNGMPAHVLLPRPIGATGGNMPHGDGAAFLGRRFDPFVLRAEPGELPAIEHLAASRGTDEAMLSAFQSAKARSAFDLRREPDALRNRYGRNRFGQSCLLARRLVEAGVQFVTVNMFETVFDELTWDMHGAKPFTPIAAYRDVVGPMFDMAYSSLLDDLAQRGLLANTMVVSMGEFGRSPRINPVGGRDHWTQCYTVLMGGGPIQGGRVIGSSDATGAEPKDRPVNPAELAATIYKGMGIPLTTELRPGLPVVEPGADPIRELFA